MICTRINLKKTTHSNEKERMRFFMWKQHIVGAVIATFIIAAAVSFNPYFASGSDEHNWGFKRAKKMENRLRLVHSLISFLINMVLFIKVSPIKRLLI